MDDKWYALSDYDPPGFVNSYDVTLQDEHNLRMLNVGLYRPSDQSWELMIDKHHFKDCKVIAWCPRRTLYRGKSALSKD